ncbi:MAG: glycosyltransferase family 4 protein [Pirellulaceae bacterium]|nr:glycosyltransferase family 4 protein [Pirellulaceae bacterium]
MNSRLRVLLIGRRFWPHGSIDSAGHLIQLACGLHRRGVHVEVLTPRYASSWNEDFCFREIRVHRPASAPRSDWSMGRYMRQMSNWMRVSAKSFDLLLVDSVREESIAAIETAREIGSATVLRAAGFGEQGDIDWWETSRAARRCLGFAKTADQIIADGAASHRALLSRGFVPSRVRRIDTGFEPAPNPAVADRVAGRRALASINSDFQAPPDHPVAVCVGSMERDCGMEILIESARHLVARYPNLHLWFIGDGSQRDSFYETLRGDGVRASIVMPGSFADLGDVYAAADLFVQLGDCGLEYQLPKALSSELPVVVIDSDASRELIDGKLTSRSSGTMVGGQVERGEQVSQPQKPSEVQESLEHWFQGGNGKSFRTAMRSALDDLSASRERAARLRRQLVRRRSQSETIDDYVRLLEQVMQNRLGNSHGPSIGAVS